MQGQGEAQGFESRPPGVRKKSLRGYNRRQTPISHSTKQPYFSQSQGSAS